MSTDTHPRTHAPPADAPAQPATASPRACSPWKIVPIADYALPTDSQPALLRRRWRSFARLLHEQLRQQDLLARLGGEEFAVVLPGIALDEARLIAERLRRRVEAMILATNDGESLHVTVSIGVSQLRPDDDDGSLDQVLERADEALYRAKANGRNRIELSADEAPEPPAR